MDSFGQTPFTVKAKVRKFFGGVNTVLGKTGRIQYSDNVSRCIIDRQLCPIMPYGYHTWNLDRCDVKNTINRGLRKGVRKGLGMKKELGQ